MAAPDRDHGHGDGHRQDDAHDHDHDHDDDPPAAAAWAEALRSWAIPQAILDAAPERPWRFPPAVFAWTPERAATEKSIMTTSRRRALEALPDGGSVLDVGIGGGRASLPLVPPAAFITGVDSSAELLAAFEVAAEREGVAYRTVLGTWPDIASGDAGRRAAADADRVAGRYADGGAGGDAAADAGRDADGGAAAGADRVAGGDAGHVAGRIGAHDIVVCHHVAYNVADLVPFVRALTDHARYRVVLELTARHPTSNLNEAWRVLHGLERPSRPTADDAVAVLVEMGLSPTAEPNERLVAATEDRAEVVAFARRRLCVGADRDPEIDRLLGPDFQSPLRQVVTIWWDGQAQG